MRSVLAFAAAAALLAAPRASAAPAASVVWEVTLAPGAEISSADAILLDARLVNRTGGTITFHQDARPVLVLAKGKGMRVEKALPQATGIHETGNFMPLDGEVAHGFHLDLRRVFGRLPAGAYSLQVVYPAAAYRVEGAGKWPRRDLASAKIAFRVTATSLADAEAANPADSELAMVLDPPSTIDGKWKRYEQAVLRNVGRRPVTFRAYVRGDPAEPLLATLEWERWSPTAGWVSPGSLGWCGTGLGEFTLAAGASERLHVSPPSADGIYRFVLRVDVAAGGSRTVPLQAFVVDNLAAY